ncbi:hypothetical protein [uncultured Bilophila sp.]|uniref:hypothetical protein n=1 Tax=uncultured Bilophila sp. TaxID=529385 RepID=UPI00280B8F21|nr:hypothetical protein [uncultured Bilophila sp.]
MVVSSPQYDENTAFFSIFPLGGIHGQGIFPVNPLELQGKSINHFYGTAFLKASAGVPNDEKVFLSIHLELCTVEYCQSVAKQSPSLQAPLMLKKSIMVRWA